MNPCLNSLEHHGIRRQRWGVRRFQNYDGTLTKAGRERQRLGKRDVSKMSRFDVNRYSNDDDSLTYMGRDKFATKKRSKRSRSRRGKIAADTVLTLPMGGSRIQSGKTIVSSNLGSVSSMAAV